MQHQEKINLKLIQVLDTFLDFLLNQIDQEHLNSKEKAELVGKTVKEAFKEAGMDCLDIPNEVLNLRNMLGKLLKSVLVQDDKLLKVLFEGYGPLATFSARIDLAYGLGYIAPLQRRDLHLIRKIRNIFAHRTGEVTFDDDDISSRCLELHHDIYNENLPPRKKFIRVAVGIAAPIHASIRQAEHPAKARDLDLQNPKFQEKAKKVRENISKILKDRV
jgi:hypothetical protein